MPWAGGTESEIFNKLQTDRNGYDSVLNGGKCDKYDKKCGV